MSLSPGKRRGLQATSSADHVFTILALDHGRSLAGTMRPEQPESVTQAEMIALKTDILDHLLPHTSAVLLDPLAGLAVPPPAAMTGLILAVEDGDYASVERPARPVANWSVGQAKQAGADAIKCFFYYHPDDQAVAAHQERFVRDLVDDCAAHDLPLFAEPLSYDTTPTTRPAVVIETARRVSRWGIEVLKTEFPIDVAAQPDQATWLAACQQLTAVCQTPWALLSAGVDFDTFAQQVTVACRAGASGYLVGRAVWKEGVVMNDDQQRDFWPTVAVPRLQKLAAIATTYGRPWSSVQLTQPTDSP